MFVKRQLKELIINDDDKNIQRTAIDNADTEILEEIANNTEDTNIITEIIRRTSDKSLLTQIADNCKLQESRELALNKLADIKLIDQVLDTSHPDVRHKAAKKISDESAYDFYKNEPDGFYRSLLVDAIDDEKILVDILRNDTYSTVRKAAAYKISDESILIDIAKNETEPFVVETIVDKIGVENIRDESIMAKYLKNAAGSPTLRNDKDYIKYS